MKGYTRSLLCDRDVLVVTIQHAPLSTKLWAMQETLIQPLAYDPCTIVYSNRASLTS